MDALQDGIVNFVLAGQPRSGREAVLLLRVAGRARSRLLRWPGSGPVLRGEGGALPAVLDVLMPDCKRMLIFRPRWTARR